MESHENSHSITVKSSECVSTLMDRIYEQQSKKLCMVAQLYYISGITYIFYDYAELSECPFITQYGGLIVE